MKNNWEKDEGKVLKKVLKKYLAVICAAFLLLTGPKITILAADFPEEELDVEESDELVRGVGEFTLADGVTASFDAESGTVTLYSEGGTLPNFWIDDMGIDRKKVKSIQVEETSGTIYLPEYSGSIFAIADLTEIDLSKFDTSNVIYMDSMFMGCTLLRELDLSNFDTSNVTSMDEMFGFCSSLTELDLSSFDTANVSSMKGMFESCRSLSSVDISNFDTSNVTDMNDMFQECAQLCELDLSNFDTSNVTSMVQMFNGCSSLRELDLKSFNTSCVEEMDDMFRECYNLEKIDLSSFNTSNVSGMRGMFHACNNLSSLNISSFDTSNVNDMEYMFYACGVESLDVSGFDTSQVVDMSNMFDGCFNLNSLDVSNFNTSNVTDMSEMFKSCINLTSLDISGFDTSNVIFITEMFCGCTNLRELDLSTMNTSKIVNARDVFSECYELRLIKTPANNSYPISLAGLMCDESGNEYSEMPIISESISLRRIIDLSQFELYFVQPDSSYAYAGHPVEPEITVTNGIITLIPDIDYTVSYINNSEIGEASVIVTGLGAVRGELSNTFYVKSGVPEFTFAEENVTKTLGDPIFFNEFTTNTDGDITYTSSDSNVATVSKDGQVRIYQTGTTVITAIVNNTNLFNGIRASYTLTVVSGNINLSECSVSVQSGDFEYSGREMKPWITVSYKKAVLSEGKEYTLSFTDNVEVGTATATVTGIGDCTGEQSVEFEIIKNHDLLLNLGTFLLVKRHSMSHLGMNLPG